MSSQIKPEFYRHKRVFTNEDCGRDALNPIHKALEEAVIADDIDTYMRLFDKYALNPSVTDVFKFDTGCDYLYHCLRYPHCSCVETTWLSPVEDGEESCLVTELSSEEPRLEIYRCSCGNGKYYKALCDAYAIVMGVYLECGSLWDYVYNPKDEDMRILRLRTKPEERKIIKWLMALNESGAFPLDKHWSSWHYGDESECYECLTGTK